MNALIVAVLAIGLPVDQVFGPYGQVVVSSAAWITVALLWRRSNELERTALMACLAIATCGEVFLSLGWGLYEYREGNIPMYVPPGHVLMFYLGTQLAARLPDGGEWWVAIAALPVVAAFTWNGRDTMGPVLYAFFLLCLFVSPSRKLYGVMFVISLVLELYGTWIGNWWWAQKVPWLGLTMDNPPLASGAFYCVLDLLVVSVVAKFQPPARPILNPSIDSTQAATCNARSSSR